MRPRKRPKLKSGPVGTKPNLGEAVTAYCRTNGQWIQRTAGHNVHISPVWVGLKSGGFYPAAYLTIDYETLGRCFTTRPTAVSTTVSDVVVAAFIDHCPPRPCGMYRRVEANSKSARYGKKLKEKQKVWADCWVQGGRVRRYTMKDGRMSSTVWFRLENGGYISAVYLLFAVDSVKEACPDPDSSGLTPIRA
ncbi:MAG TPA: hypothetical protein VMR98_03440 [Candidatus Polarisedimenticolaceae bacterium]|nr:hypothetical protein [Candidatus Polarisedimenticolaceae bacterium]